jgi:hypothetical protein
MGQGYKARPEGMAAIAKRLDDMQKQIDALRNASGIQNGSIDNGGQLVVKDVNGNQVVKLGYDSAGVRGAALTSPSGVDMLNFYVQTGTGLPYLVILDSTSNLALATDSDGDGSGLYWPWIPVPIQTQKIANWPSTNSTSFDTVSSGGSYKFSQRLHVYANVICDGGATAGQARILVNGTQVGSTVNVSTTLGTTFMGTPDFASNVLAADYAWLEIQAKVTAGSGNCRVQVFECWWTSSI